MSHFATVDALSLEVKAISSGADSRFRLWENFVNTMSCKNALELGVFKGDFAEHLLRRCPSITTYHMLDPWRHLEDWNKPANKTDDVFNEYLAMVRERTAFAKDRVVIHRGTTLEVIDQVPNSSIDFAYIDGDHTLQGISIDLHRAWPKVRPGGWLAGDDFYPSIWQHSMEYEPTLVFPFAIYFAKAVNSPIFAVGHSQFLIWKSDSYNYAFHDLFQSYPEPILRSQMIARNKYGGEHDSCKPAGLAVPETSARPASVLGKMTKRSRQVMGRALTHLSPRLREHFNIVARGVPPFPNDITTAGCLLIHIPKTAGTSLSMALYGRSIGHKSLAEWEECYPYSVPRIFKVAVVREPIDRFCSAFSFLKGGGMNDMDKDFARRVLYPFASANDLAKALLDPNLQQTILTQGWHFRRQLDFLRSSRNSVDVDLLIPFEDLDVGAERLFQKLSHSRQLPRLNTTRYEKQLLDNEASIIINDLYREDLRAWEQARHSFGHIHCKSTAKLSPLA